MSTTRPVWPLTAGLVLSLTLHILAALLVIGGLSLSPRQHSPIRQKHNQSRVQPPQLTLGIDAQTPARITWIGYEQYREHRAHPAEIEQAAMTLSPGTPTSPSAPVSPTQNPPPPTLHPQPLEDALRAVAELAEQAWISASRLTELSDDIDPDASPPETPVEPAYPAARPAPDEPSPDKPGESGRDPGDPADAEADATALKRAVTLADWGRPLAAHGLTIQTRKPRFAHLTTFLVVPQDPVVLIEFGREVGPDGQLRGKVRRARFLRVGDREYNTGDERVDKPIMAAIYEWTATGKAIEDLPADDPEAVATLSIRLVLMDRRR